MESSTARRIIREALYLFAAKGYQATGIRDIAAAANVSSAALYHYMGGKEDLLLQIMERNLRRWLEGARRAAHGIEMPESRVAMFVRAHAMSAARYQLESTVVDTEIRSLRHGPRRRIVALRDEYEGLLAQGLSDGEAAGVFHSPDVRLARLALVEMCNGVSRWYSPKGRASLAEVGDHFADMALALLRARRGARVLTLAELGLPPSDETLRVLVGAYEELEADDEAAVRVSGTNGTSTSQRAKGR